MFLLRLGPQFLFLRSAEPGRIESALAEVATACGLDLKAAMTAAGENDTVAFLTPPGPTQTRVADARQILYLPSPAAAVLACLINTGAATALARIDLGPGTLILRIPAPGSSLVERLTEEYGGRRVGFVEGIDAGEAGDTLLGFTAHPIRSVVPLDQVEATFLLVPRPAGPLLRDLRRGAVRYFTETLDKGEWYELRINIYDAYGNYTRHLERLVLTLEELELGLILGEVWTRDHGFALLSVTAYQVRLFTPYSPLKIKRVLMGLEYNAAGERMVDLDLYYKNQKVNWVSTVEGRRQSRSEAGAAARAELLAQLSPAAREKLEQAGL
ncbi:MAG TPA: hypothetical protein GX511_06445 [Firmicutes bacterium]|nr:hypothetical protein [Bacillota bacterium]